jgi:uncharacterized membrane protein YkvI
MEKKRKINKLLLIAIIVAPLLWVGLMTAETINVNKSAVGEYYLFYDDNNTDEMKNAVIKEITKNLMREMLITAGIGLTILAIPTLLTIIGDRKNKRKMILAAGIVYIVTILGILSAVLCFIVNTKMKKQE